MKDETNTSGGSAAGYGSAPDKARLKAKMDGACAALEGRKPEANPYNETDDLHFEWLDGWTSARMEMQKRGGQNASDQLPRQ